MMSKNKLVLAVIAATVVMAGCASPNYPSSNYPSSNYPSSSYPSSNTGSYPASSRSSATMYGVVDSIQITQGNANNGVGAGAIVGGVVGGLLGNQVGGGSGRAVATAAGVVGGAVVGNQIEQNRRGPGQDLYVVGVRLDNGGYQTYTQESVSDLRIGNRVRVDGGRVYRY